MDQLSHLDEQGRANMVDVGDKPSQKRRATASGFIRLKENTLKLIQENAMKKGDVFTVAEIAGVQAAKQTPSLIPLCHGIQLSQAVVRCTAESKGIRVESRMTSQGQTGVEMEALTAVSVALLTIYDMCKAVDKEMMIEEIRLVEKVKS